MADEGTIMWTGVSDQKYEYWIYRIGASFKSEPGNYIFAKVTKSTESKYWTPLYVGETDDLNRRLTPNHEKMPCVKRNGGTHVHVHISSKDEATRQKEEADIRDKWNPPCNLED